MYMYLDRFKTIGHAYRVKVCDDILGGGFKHFLFSPLPGEMIQFDDHIFQMGWLVQPLTSMEYRNTSKI